MLDVDGQTTLHAAVKLCYPEVTSILLAAADPKGLQIENGVGNTPFEIISLTELSSRIKRFPQNPLDNRISSSLRTDSVDTFYRYREDYIQRLRNELPKLNAILDVLFAEGKLKRQTKLATELIKFASLMKDRLSVAEAAHTARLARFPPKKEEEKVSLDDPKDRYDLEKTSSIVAGALKGSTVNRQLIHLIDVQKSVGADLEGAGNSTRRSNESIPTWRGRGRRRQIEKVEGEFEAEQGEEEKEKAQSMVWQFTSNVYPDSM